MNKEQKVGAATGKLRNFVIEPFVAHKDEEEMYVCIYSHRHADSILFYHQGGVDIGDVDSKAVKLDVAITETTSVETISKVRRFNFELNNLCNQKSNYPFVGVTGSSSCKEKRNGS